MVTMNGDGKGAVIVDESGVSKSCRHGAKHRGPWCLVFVIIHPAYFAASRGLKRWY